MFKITTEIFSHTFSKLSPEKFPVLDSVHIFNLGFSLDELSNADNRFWISLSNFDKSRFEIHLALKRGLSRSEAVAVSPFVSSQPITAHVQFHSYSMSYAVVNLFYAYVSMLLVSIHIQHTRKLSTTLN